MNRLAPLRALVAELLRAYAAVLFCDSPRVGAWFMLVTWCSPAAAAAGLGCLLASAAWAKAMSIEPAGRPHLVNGLLAGLFLGAFHPFGWTLVAALAAVALLVVLSSQWLSVLLWRAGRLPVLSLPFVLACWVAALVVPWRPVASTLADPFADATAGGFTLFPPALDGFFTALGWLFLVPYPLAGALLFAGLLVASRYLAALALAGYLAGMGALALAGQGGFDPMAFNHMLVAMALGGIFAVPSRTSFAVAVAGAAFSALFARAFGAALAPLHLPLVTLPFLAVVLLWLGALSTRAENRGPRLILDAPDAPERTYERERIAQVRGSLLDSLPLVAPFFGEWRVSQGFDGPHTHRAPWQHALDVEIADQGRNRRLESDSPRDFLCFGAPVLAPAAAQVVKARDDLPDVQPGHPDTANNWGNHVMLRTPSGAHVLLAHLLRGSLRVQPGEWVVAGQPLAACGSSGRSPEPHLHVQVQSPDALGSPTRPFHLANVLVRAPGGEPEFRLFCVPSEGELVSSAPRDEGLAAALRLPQGLELEYRLTDARGVRRRTLRSDRTLLGEARLVSDSGASAAFEESPYAIGWFDRRGGRDRMLDLWQLCLGLTPLSSAAATWRDRPPLALVPMGPLRRVAASLARPLGAGCDSRYRRSWDEKAHAWRQDGVHRFRPLPGIEWTATTQAWLSPQQGVTRLRMESGSHRWEAVLDEAMPGAGPGQESGKEATHHMEARTA